jgi:hypothetical protein
MGFKTFLGLVLLLAVLGIVRSAIATRLDGFTLDEAYHIAAGVSYVRYGDFRINPEHPPLVKMWVGGIVAATGFHLEPIRQFSDKPDERAFTQSAVFLKNDPDSVQRRARDAMFVLNTLLLISLALALERVFDAPVALGALLFLVIDPTVAAHWPVVMTDLPVALLMATATVLATRAFRDWLWKDLAACSVFLGLALAAKHSAPVVLLSVVSIGMWMAFSRPIQQGGDSRSQRVMKAGIVLAGAILILWGFYFFRYAETRSGQELFNRPLADKIQDVNTPFYHSVLAGMATGRVVPRAYLWGFADTVHAGMEGRPFPHLIFGRFYLRKGPIYFFPAMIALKLPIGLSALSILGLIFFFSHRLPAEWNFPAGVVLATSIWFLLVLANGAIYAGIRHALPVLVLLSIFAGLFVERALISTSLSLKGLAVLAYVLAGASALPAFRPWEYFNEFVGGPQNAYKYFDDEGVDLGQRSKELVAYYRRFLKPAGEMAYVIYGRRTESSRRGVFGPGFAARQGSSQSAGVVRNNVQRPSVHLPQPLLGSRRASRCYTESANGKFGGVPRNISTAWIGGRDALLLRKAEIVCRQTGHDSSREDVSAVCGPGPQRILCAHRAGESAAEARRARGSVAGVHECTQILP